MAHLSKSEDLARKITEVVGDYVKILNVSDQLCSGLMDFFNNWLVNLDDCPEYDPNECLKPLTIQLIELNKRALRTIRTCIKLRLELPFLFTNNQQWGIFLSITEFALNIAGLMGGGTTPTDASTGDLPVRLAVYSEGTEITHQLSTVLGVIEERCSIIQGYVSKLPYKSDAAIIRWRTHKPLFIKSKLQEILDLLQKFKEFTSRQKATRRRVDRPKQG